MSELSQKRRSVASILGEDKGNATMGYLARGTWVDEWYDTTSSGGRFVRQDSRFRAWLGQGGDYSPEAGRYHLYVSWACPWVHRTLIYRALKGLNDAIGVTVVDPLMLSKGWVIPPDADPVNHAQFLWQILRTPTMSVGPPFRSCGIGDGKR
jgi:glutathionyl-hydroquinone reductase